MARPSAGLAASEIGWRKIAVALIEAEEGEAKAQACEKAWFRQLPPPDIRPSMNFFFNREGKPFNPLVLRLVLVEAALGVPRSAIGEEYHHEKRKQIRCVEARQSLVGQHYEARRQARALLLFLCVSLAIGLSSVRTASAAGVTLTLSSTSGPPTSNLLVSAGGFPASTAVDIYFDTTDVALAVTSGTGAFSGIALKVPASAVPGTHWVTAVARGTSGKAAQASFLVQTNWAQFHYSVLHKSVNPYENVLSPTTVGSIGLDWSFTTGGEIYLSAPAVANGVVYFGSQDSNLYALNPLRVPCSGNTPRGVLSCVHRQWPTAWSMSGRTTTASMP